ncbi:hypothetical protein RhiirA4_424847 [Rhizophagus irregularis]|uniref:Uncharacterized protein n=1 Tax=Rhizophagus irregularis TaxID=588596 RepID=A0A2I1GZ39_9GLOM|nr:hypothetical protein RhiirA4_424847 [Rhizophagus irregularis]
MLATPQKRKKYWEVLIISNKTSIMIFGRIRSLEESVTSRFMSINVVIEDLQNKINQHYAVVQRSDFDQQSASNESEANSTNESETDSRGSSTNSSSSSSDQMCAVVSVDILNRLGMGVIGKDMIKGFYRGENIKSENLEKIGAWIDNRHLHHY